ncbi:DUF924 domain-containing protein [Synechococcus sp. Nb3U1]|uniref:DUF924 family protein n=1 Tax=Synechococcus sp. Nb3U1 TaxID=1914529 RepID=UPI001F1825CC|nr:DUF924 family protein [Synechococcus sp. Nb3U1]MCF2972189.1 DUF924 domain-containing protein [Synechococcus sp. Nb3U1]
MTVAATTPEEILKFWFGDPTGSEYGQSRPEWFKKDPEFDRTIEEQFLPVYEQAAAGQLESWQGSPSTCLALILVLDQFPRNMFRDTPRAFATDPLALQAARQAVTQGFDRQLLPVQRWFVYLPFEHSEDLADQQRSMELFGQLQSDPASQSAIDYARRHLEIIKRFGRFPHRNTILGRPSTPAELEFLQQPGSSF